MLLQGSGPSCAAHTLQVTCSCCHNSLETLFPTSTMLPPNLGSDLHHFAPRRAVLSLEKEVRVVLLPSTPSVLSWGKGLNTGPVP